MSQASPLAYGMPDQFSPQFGEQADRWGLNPGREDTELLQLDNQGATCSCSTVWLVMLYAF